MFRKLVIATLILIGSLSACGADFSLSITSAPKTVPQGAPVSVTVILRNVSGHPITVARGYGGFDYKLSVTRTDGNPRKGCKQPPVATYISGFSKKTLPADWCQSRVEDLTCDDEPGEWIVQAAISCQGPYPIYERGQVVGQFNGWSGEIKSEEARIKIVKPSGVDLEAYNYFKGCPRCDQNELLRLFPSSTYAGYALLPGDQCIPDPRVFLVNYLECDKTAQRWPQTANQMAKEKERDIRENTEKANQLQSYLKVRPDFARANALKVELAGRLAALQRFQESEELCEEIEGKAPGSLESQKADMLLEYLTKKGFLENKESKKDKK